MKKITFYVLSFIGIFIFASCSKSAAQNDLSVTLDTGLVKGADISWLPQMEASGFVFYNDNGKAEDCFKILKEHGINAIRLRTWVNPSEDPGSGHCSAAETLTMALRAKKWGMRVMIDFHYSDSWADPSKQVKPAAWQAHTFPQLLNDVYHYTYNVMQTLKDNDITPEWVQVGNEITNGMLLPEGSVAHWDSLSQLLNKGYDAVKAVSPATKVVLHVDQGNNNQRFRWWFDSATVHHTRYDIIGMSYYPYWLPGKPDYILSINDLSNNMIDVSKRYNKDVMIVEVGGESIKPQNTYDMLKAVIKKVKAVPNNRGLGVMYWEPEGANIWSHYGLSAWSDDGKPTMAMDAFK